MANLLKISDIYNLFGISRYLVEKFVSAGSLEEIRFNNGTKYYRLNDCIKLWGKPNDINQLKENDMGTITSTLFLKKMLDLLVKPFPEWEAYRAGIINAQGDVISSKADYRKYFKDPLLKLVKNLKRILIKYGVPDTVHGMSLVSLFLLKEDILSNSLTKEQSTKCLAEIETMKSEMDLEDKLLLEKFVRHASYLGAQAYQKTLKEFMPVEENDEFYEFKKYTEILED